MGCACEDGIRMCLGRRRYKGPPLDEQFPIIPISATPNNTNTSPTILDMDFDGSPADFYSFDVATQGRKGLGFHHMSSAPPKSPVRLTKQVIQKPRAPPRGKPRGQRSGHRLPLEPVVPSTVVASTSAVSSGTDSDKVRIGICWRVPN